MASYQGRLRYCIIDKWIADLEYSYKQICTDPSLVFGNIVYSLFYCRSTASCIVLDAARVPESIQNIHTNFEAVDKVENNRLKYCRASMYWWYGGLTAAKVSYSIPRWYNRIFSVSCFWVPSRAHALCIRCQYRFPRIWRQNELGHRLILIGA